MVLAVAAAMDLVLRAAMAWNKPWKGRDLEHVEDIARATLVTGLTSSNEWLMASRLLDFGPYLFSTLHILSSPSQKKFMQKACAIYRLGGHFDHKKPGAFSLHYHCTSLYTDFHMARQRVDWVVCV